MEDKKKILFIGNDWFSLYNYRKELIQQLVYLGYDVYACVIEDANNKKIEELGVKVLIVPMERRGVNPLKDIKTYKAYKKIFKELKPSIAIAYTIKPCIYGGWAARKYKVPFIATITGLGIAFQKGKILEILVTMMYKRAFKKAKAIFFQNDENKQIFLDKKIINFNQIRRVNGSGVDLEKFNLLPYPNDKEINFIFVARILKEKGIDEYLKSAQEITQKYKNTKFHIFGKCTTENYIPILKDYEKQGYIKYYGQQQDMKPFQELSSCTVLPTYYPEGMANVLLESNASGRPIITTDVCGCREVLENGKNGLLVKQHDAQDLIKTLEKFINLSNEERKQMGLNGRLKMEKEFDRKIVIAQYVEEIQKIV